MGDYENQGMALKLREHDDALKQYETFAYKCEAHVTFCCGGAVADAKKTYPFTIASADRGASRFDDAGECTEQAAYRVIILE